MPDSTLINLAEAIVAHLRDGTFSLPFEVQRAYRPVVELPALTAVKVSVIPKSVTMSVAARADSFYECAIDIGVQSKVNPDDPAELDALMKLVEEIGDRLRGKRLDGFPAAVWVSVENDPAFAPEHLDKEAVFTSLLTVTYRVRR